MIIAVPLELLFPLSLLEGSPPGNSAIRRHTESHLFIHKYTAYIQMYCIHLSPIAQGEISRSLAFPTHVWEMPNICKHIIVWFLSHMCAFSQTYVSKSKHVWKKAPRCKYTNVFGFFQTCWVKVKHLPKCNLKHRFGFFLTYLQKQTCKEKTNMFSLNTTILFFLWEMKIL